MECNDCACACATVPPMSIRMETSSLSRMPLCPVSSVLPGASQCRRFLIICFFLYASIQQPNVHIIACLSQCYFVVRTFKFEAIDMSSGLPLQATG